MTTSGLWADGMRVSSTVMTAATNANIEQLRARALAICTQGRLTGGTVTPGATAGTINIAAVTGLTTNGELAAITVATANQALADSTNGAYNYPCLVYAEAYGSAVAHETSGSTINTARTASPRIVVLTDTQIAALPATSTTQGVNALDRLLILGEVVAQGAGVAIPLSAITQTAISSEQRQVSWSSAAIPGFTLGSISSNAPAGSATLSYNATTDAITLQLNGEGGPGSATTPVRTTDSITVVSLDGYRLTIAVTGDLLPASGTVAHTITVNTMWPTPSVFVTSPGTAVDTRLRSTVSTLGNRSARNPLALSLDALVNEGGLTLPFRGLLDLGRAIVDTAARARSIPRLFLRTRSGDWTLLLKWRASASAHWRLWNSAAGGYVATYNADFDGTNFVSDTGAVAYMFGGTPTTGFTTSYYDATAGAGTTWLLADWEVSMTQTNTLTTINNMANLTLSGTLTATTSDTDTTLASVAVVTPVVIGNATIPAAPVANSTYGISGLKVGYAFAISAVGVIGYTLASQHNVASVVRTAVDTVRITFTTPFMAGVDGWATYVIDRNGAVYSSLYIHVLAATDTYVDLQVYQGGLLVDLTTSGFVYSISGTMFGRQ